MVTSLRLYGSSDFSDSPIIRLYCNGPILTKRPYGKHISDCMILLIVPILLFYDCTCNCSILTKRRFGNKSPIVRFLVVLSSNSSFIDKRTSQSIRLD